jgi:hypothetical protein
VGFAGILRQSTAVDVLIGPFVDSSNGDDEEGGLTIAQADVRLSKNGQTAAQKNDNTTCAHDADGFYNCELDATDTNTVGQLTLYVHVAGALCVRHDFQVVEENVYDAYFVASATGGTDLAAILVDTGTTLQGELDAVQADTEDIQSRLPAALVGGRIDANTGAISGDATAADNLEAALDGTGGVTITAALTGNVTGNLSGSVGSVTGNVGGNVTGSVGSLATQAKADVNAEVDTALTDYDAVVPGDLPANFADLAITATTGRVSAGTVVDKTGYSLAADQSGVTIGTVNSLASGAVAAASLAAAACAKVADIVLRRSWASAAASSDGDTKSFRSLLGAVAKLVNKIDTTTNAGKLTVFEADDSTELGTQTLSTDGSAEPIVAADTD